MTHIKVVKGDITTYSGDAIVNAANSALSGGGGVDGAIHKSAGPELLAECRTLGRCPTGEARITKAYRLPVKFVIHTVGPVWYGGDHNEEELLQSCYINSLDMCMKNNIKTVAFPNISCGVYRFPKQRASEIAMATIRYWLQDHPDAIDEVVVCCFNDDLYNINLKLLGS